MMKHPALSLTLPDPALFQEMLAKDILSPESWLTTTPWIVLFSAKGFDTIIKNKIVVDTNLGKAGRKFLPL